MEGVNKRHQAGPRSESVMKNTHRERLHPSKVLRDNICPDNGGNCGPGSESCSELSGQPLSPCQHLQRLVLVTAHRGYIRTFWVSLGDIIYRIFPLKQHYYILQHRTLDWQQNRLTQTFSHLKIKQEDGV